jgi:hypothetical protein
MFGILTSIRAVVALQPTAGKVPTIPPGPLIEAGRAEAGIKKWRLEMNQNPSMKTKTRIVEGVCAWHGSRTTLVVIVCLGLAGLLLSTVQEPLRQIPPYKTIDPYVYAAYINDYAGTLKRFGSTYYASRVAYIYPERALVSLLGLDAGYYAFRFLAVVIAIGSVLAIGWRYYGLPTALFVSAWVCLTPWLPAQLLYTHYDGIAVIYTLLALALVLVPTRWRFTGHVAAGAAFALAVNCTQLAATMGAAFLPGWIVLNRACGARWMVQAALCVFGGFVIGYAAPIFILETEFPGFGFASAANSIFTAFYLAGGGWEQWFHPLGEILSQPNTVVLLIPTTLLIFGILAYLKRPLVEKTPEQARFAMAALLYLGAMWALDLFSHFVLSYPLFSYPLQIVNFFPASALVLISLTGEVEVRQCSRSNLYIAFISIILVWLLLPSVWPWVNAPKAATWVALTAVVVAGTGLLVVKSGQIVSAVLLVAVLTVSFAPAFTPQYGLVAGPAERQREWDVYHGAVFLQKFVDARVSPSQTIGFWYSNQDVLMTSIQSIFLYEYSRVAPQGRDHPGMPLLDETTRTAIAKKKFLVLLATSEAETDKALNAIREARQPFRFVDRKNFRGETWGFDMVLLRIMPRPLGARLFEVPLSRLAPDHKGKLTEVADGIRLTTGNQQYGYYLLGCLRGEGERLEGKAVVRVELQVQEGTAGIAVEDANNKSKLFEVSVGESNEMEAIDIEIPDLAAAGRFIVRNYRTRPSTVTIHSIQVFRLN